MGCLQCRSKPAGRFWQLLCLGRGGNQEFLSTIQFYQARRQGYYNSIGTNISGDMNFDAATHVLGQTWRMPTYAEARELVEKCTWRKTTRNNVPRYSASGSIGNQIFIPAQAHMTINSYGNTVVYTDYYYLEFTIPN